MTSGICAFCEAFDLSEAFIQTLYPFHADESNKKILTSRHAPSNHALHRQWPAGGRKKRHFLEFMCITT